MKHALLTLVLLSLITIAPKAFGAESFQMDIDDQTPKLLEGPSYMVFNHSGPWDDTKKSLAGVRKMIATGGEHGIPRIAMIDVTTLTESAWKSKEKYQSANQAYFFEPDEIDLVVGSNGGPHHLQFVNAKKLFFAGGFLDLCLCEAMRDSLRWTDIYRTREDLQIFLIRDAIYDTWGNEVDAINLEEKLQRGRETGTTDAQFAMYNDFLSTRPSCGQNYLKQPELKLEGVRFRFYVDEHYVISAPASGGRPFIESDLKPRSGSVDVRFIHSRDLEKYVD